MVKVLFWLTAGKRFVNELNTRKLFQVITGLNEIRCILVFDSGVRAHFAAVEFYDHMAWLRRAHFG